MLPSPKEHQYQDQWDSYGDECNPNDRKFLRDLAVGVHVDREVIDLGMGDTVLMVGLYQGRPSVGINIVDYRILGLFIDISMSSQLGYIFPVNEHRDGYGQVVSYRPSLSVCEILGCRMVHVQDHISLHHRDAVHSVPIKDYMCIAVHYRQGVEVIPC